ncbi:MAG: CPBP family intramembrane glutamic endopeptidase [Chloroflexota bacterium]|nr:CPBP family intramembrane glutamic endopeptidase [Chloroflexota bacterium]
MRLFGWSILSPPEIPGTIFLKGHLVILTFIAIGVWTPITEEILFRGFIYAGLRNRWGQMQAAVFSSLLFSLAHAQLGVLLPTFVMGMALTFLYIRTKSIWPCILAHTLNNAVTLGVVLASI